MEVLKPTTYLGISALEKTMCVCFFGEIWPFLLKQCKKAKAFFMKMENKIGRPWFCRVSGFSKKMPTKARSKTA